MVPIKLKAINSFVPWRASGRYKANTTVLFSGETYQNITGKNSIPSNLIDWIVSSFSSSLGTEVISKYAGFSFEYSDNFNMNIIKCDFFSDQDIEIKVVYRSEIGDYVDFVQYGVGVPTIVADAPIVIVSTSSFNCPRVKYSMIRATKVGEFEWLLSGDLRLI